MDKLIDFIVSNGADLFVILVLFISALIMWELGRIATTKRQHIKYWFWWCVLVMVCSVQIGRLLAIL